MSSRTSTSARRRVATPVVLDYLLSHLGFFTVLPVLPVLLQDGSTGGSPWTVGIALFAFNAAVRGASLLCAGALHRRAVRSTMVLGLLLGGVGFALLSVAPGPVAALLCLLLAGTGISINGLMARVFVALRLPGAVDRNAVFSAVQVAVNVGAALGPVISNLLLDRAPTALLLGVAAAYVLAAAAVAVTVDGDVHPGHGDVRPPLRLALLRDVVTDPAVRHLSLCVALGSFLYAQFFSSVALHVATLSGSPLVRASFFVVNAGLVIVVQAPVSTAIGRALDGGTRPPSVLLLGTGLFAVSFATMALGGSLVVGVMVAVVVFSVAETVFTPMVSTAFAELGGDRPAVELFNLRQVAATVGEASGAFAGGALYTVAAAARADAAYWAALGLLAVVGIGVLRRPRTEASS